MPNKNGYFDTDNRQLTDVFRDARLCPYMNRNDSVDRNDSWYKFKKKETGWLIRI